MILPEQRVKVRAGAFQRRLFCYNVLRLQLARIGGFPLEAAERVCVVQVDVFVALCVGVNIVGAVGVWSGDKRRVALVEGFSYSTLSALCPGSVICFAAASLPPSTYMPKPPCSISAELTSCARADTPEMTTSAPKMTAVHNSFFLFFIIVPSFRSAFGWCRQSRICRRCSPNNRRIPHRCLRLRRRPRA